MALASEYMFQKMYRKIIHWTNQLNRERGRVRARKTPQTTSEALSKTTFWMMFFFQPSLSLFPQLASFLCPIPFPALMKSFSLSPRELHDYPPGHFTRFHPLWPTLLRFGTKTNIFFSTRQSTHQLPVVDIVVIVVTVVVAQTTHSFACSTLLASLTRSAVLTRLFAHFAHSLARGTVNGYSFCVVFFCSGPRCVYLLASHMVPSNPF